MNSKKVLILLLLLIIIVTFTAYLTTQPQTDYQIAVNRFQKISIEAVEQKIQHQESFYLYTGREGCPYCQKFAPKLAKAVDKTKRTVYYLDSEHIDKSSWNNFKKNRRIQKQSLISLTSQMVQYMTYYRKQVKPVLK